MANILIVGLVALELFGLGGSGWTTALANRTAAKTVIKLESYHPLATPSFNGNLPAVSAAGIMVIDSASGQALYAKDGATQRPIASLTKIFTILVVLRDHNLDESVAVPTLPAYEPGAVLLSAPAGAKFKLGDLVKAALIPSDNDAADTLAIYDAGSIPAFTAKMNQLMASWGIRGVHFSSANGLTDSDNYATPAALAAAARLLLANPQAKTITGTSSAAISDLSGRSYALHSTNQLLQEPGFYGIKTGYTPAAGECLVARAQINGHDVISVVLGSSDRFGDTRTLINQLTAGISWQ